MAQSINRPFWTAVLAFCAILPASGCVRRRLTVRSFPPGAQVFVDDQDIGSTPCSSAFVYYGSRKIMLVKDGYRTETFYQPINAPWYQIPPLDFISENLTFSETRDERVIDVRLTPQENVSPQDLLNRAGALRENSRLGIITAPPKTPPGANLPPEPNFNLPGQGLPGGKPILYPGGPLQPTPPAVGLPPGPAYSPAVEPLPPLPTPPGGIPLLPPNP